MVTLIIWPNRFMTAWSDISLWGPSTVKNFIYVNAELLMTQSAFIFWHFLTHFVMFSSRIKLNWTKWYFINPQVKILLRNQLLNKENQLRKQSKNWKRNRKRCGGNLAMFALGCCVGCLATTELMMSRSALVVKQVKPLFRQQGAEMYRQE